MAATPPTLAPLDSGSLGTWDQEAPRWLDEDLALITTEEGWTPLTRAASPVEWRRAMSYDPNYMFRWRLDLDVPHDVVFEVLVHRIAEYHQHFTKELIDATVVAEPGPRTKVIHQRFRSGFPGISPRDLCHINVTRQLDDGSLLASHRSVGLVPPQSGFERLQWWGCTLCRPASEPGKSTLWYTDQENVGGRIPAWVTNKAMVNYTRIHRRNIADFFRGGGPPSVYSAVGRAAPAAAS